MVERGTLFMAIPMIAAYGTLIESLDMQVNGHHDKPLPPPDAKATRAYLDSLIEALGDTPETVIPLQFLHEQSCEVLCVGDPAQLEGIIIQAFEMPQEPIAFGTSAEAVASLLPHISGWTCLNVPANLADGLLEPFGEIAGASGIRLLDDVYHTLETPVDRGLVGDARLLTPMDIDVIDSAPEEMIGDGRDRLLETIQHGHVAGAIRDNMLVSFAYTFATSDRHADIGVVTHPDWRGQDLATSVSATVIMAVQAEGRTPVWSCGSTNLASMRVASKLGMQEVSRRVYLIPEFGEAEAGS